MTKPWDAAVMIPACREAELLPGCLASLASLPQRSIVVVVLNQRIDCHSHVKAENDQIRTWFYQFPVVGTFQGDPIFSIENLHVMLLDYASGDRCLSSRQGVGFARHVGMIRCCDLYDAKLLLSPWIRSTDADARFGEDFLRSPPDDASVCILPYRHQPAPPALQIYDIGLRYFALGLKWAGSPYSFPTLGSVIAIHADFYRQIGGFPDRQAGEDFYLLNKASKVGVLRYLNRKPVLLIGRPSDRVPFGTGRGMMEIEAKELKHNFYSPGSFVVLRDWMSALNEASDPDLLDILEGLAPGFSGLKKFSKALRQPAKGAQVIKRRHAFFDAFWIMKLMHYLRDTTCPPMPWRDALDLAPFISIVSKTLDDVKLDLETAERLELCGREYGLKASGFIRSVNVNSGDALSSLKT